MELNMDVILRNSEKIEIIKKHSWPSLKVAMAPTVETTAIDVSQCWFDDSILVSWLPAHILSSSVSHKLSHLSTQGKGPKNNVRYNWEKLPTSLRYFQQQSRVWQDPHLSLSQNYLQTGCMRRVFVQHWLWGSVTPEVAASVPPWSLFLPSGLRPDLARWRGTSPIKAAHCDKAISFPSASL